MDPWEKINRLRASAQKDKAIYSKTVIYSPTRTHRRIPYMHIKFERREYGVSDGTIYQRRTRYSNCLINHITFSLLKTCEKRAPGAPAREGREQRRGWGKPSSPPGEGREMQNPHPRSTPPEACQDQGTQETPITKILSRFRSSACPFQPG